jgi:hypothetical protein
MDFTPPLSATMPMKHAMTAAGECQTEQGGTSSKEVCAGQNAIPNMQHVWQLLLRGCAAQLELSQLAQRAYSFHR